MTRRTGAAPGAAGWWGRLERRHWPLAAAVWIAAVTSGGFLTFVASLQVVGVLVWHASFPVWRPSLWGTVVAGPFVWAATLAVLELLWLLGVRTPPRRASRR